MSCGCARRRRPCRNPAPCSGFRSKAPTTWWNWRRPASCARPRPSSTRRSRTATASGSWRKPASARPPRWTRWRRPIPSRSIASMAPSKKAPPARRRSRSAGPSWISRRNNLPTPRCARRSTAPCKAAWPASANTSSPAHPSSRLSALIRCDFGWKSPSGTRRTSGWSKPSGCGSRATPTSSPAGLRASARPSTNRAGCSSWKPTSPMTACSAPGSSSALKS